MRNPESHSASEHVPGHGRERVPTAAALDAQKKLVVHMTPERIIPYIDFNNVYDPFLDALMLRYMLKYDSGDYNGFAEYCDAHEDDSFMDRVVNQELTTEDLDGMKAAMIAHDSYTPFFADEGEVDEFIKSNTH